ncbi:Phenylalanine--tRNA ligase alpha subunit [Buchnera aphidicola (Eriosoma grossulariae)]|uniref:phenylalanine--tRNA ligase subunit alpha n=1 Tax=Buchnera aphidicola TaxID=9 RepID=UPI0034645ECC
MKLLMKLIDSTKKEIINAITIKDLERIRIECLGKRGYLNLKIKELNLLNNEKKKIVGSLLNKIKKDIQTELFLKKNNILKNLLDLDLKKDKIDVTLTGRRIINGNLHPITTTINFLNFFFEKLGFNCSNGPEIEDIYHNFDALNIDPNHPSRDMKNTFWFDCNRLLRTQTSSMQVRIMETKSLPIRYIIPGKVYRNDYDSTHTPMFHQIEGLIIDKNINFSQLKWILESCLIEFFDNNIELRFRSSYFPFTVPSIEIDIKGNQGKWLEILGGGMIHPKVLKNLNIDPLSYSGCAFGIGVERLTMLKYDIFDIRSFFKNDIRFLKQFK